MHFVIDCRSKVRLEGCCSQLFCSPKALADVCIRAGLALPALQVTLLRSECQRLMDRPHFRASSIQSSLLLMGK